MVPNIVNLPNRTPSGCMATWGKLSDAGAVMTKLLDYVEPYPVEEFFVTDICEVTASREGILRFVFCAEAGDRFEGKVKLLIPLTAAVSMNSIAAAIITAEYRRLRPLKLVN